MLKIDEDDQGDREEKLVEEPQEEEVKNEDSGFEGDDLLVKETGRKLILQNDIVDPQNAKKSIFLVNANRG